MSIVVSRSQLGATFLTSAGVPFSDAFAISAPALDAPVRMDPACRAEARIPPVTRMLGITACASGLNLLVARVARQEFSGSRQRKPLYRPEVGVARIRSAAR